MPNKCGNQKLDHPQGLSFCGQERTVLLCKSNLEQGNSASDWLKLPISTLLTQIHFGFLCFISQIWLCITRSLFTVNHREHRGALNNDIGNCMVSHFYPIDNSAEWEGMMKYKNFFCS